MVHGNILDQQTAGEGVKGSAADHLDGLTIHVHLAGVIEPSVEIQRLEKEMGRLQSDLEKYKYKLSNEDFLKKAPQEVIEETKTTNNQIRERYEQLNASMNRMKELLK
jgi:valyl-tRNA synthetase